MPTASQETINIQQDTFVVPDFSVKELLSPIPAHCYERSTFRSSLYVVLDLVMISAIYKTATYIDSTLIIPNQSSFPHPAAYAFARLAVWALYGFGAGLFGTGLWVIGHDCGHQAFSDSKFISHSVGWVLHSALGVPYHSWRITHGKHHASTGHLTQDQVFVPMTRSQLRLPAFDPSGEDIHGGSISEEVRKELWDALGDSPIGAALGALSYLIFGWPLYVMFNMSGQTRYPKGTSHFKPSAVMFAPHQHRQVVLSDIGVILWLSSIATWIYYKGFVEVFTLYVNPYLWVNHWLVLITFLQHTDPLIPHYRAPAFTFTRGALSTLDRRFLGDCGSIMSWIGTVATHGVCEIHVLHHVSSKIPHYNAWEARDALRNTLGRAGFKLQGAPASWAEFYRVFKECKFVEDEGNVVFYKNAHGLAKVRAVLPDNSASDSGIAVDK